MKGKYLDVNSKTDAQGQHVGFTNKVTGAWNDHQKWSIVYKDDTSYKHTYAKKEYVAEFGFHNHRDFHIVTALPSRRYAELIAGNNLALKVSNGRKGQVWYFDWTTKTLKSKSNNQSLSIVSSGASNKLNCAGTNGYWYQVWKYQGMHLVNWRGKALDVYQGKDVEGQNIIANDKRTNGLNQKWRIVYVDQVKKAKSKGYDAAWGMHWNRPFVLATELPSNRYLFYHANNYLYITNQVNRPQAQQQFAWDIVTKTIKSHWRKNYAIEVMSNGNSNTAYCRANPTSRWWQLHKYKQPYLVNTKGKVLEVTGASDTNMR